MFKFKKKNTLLNKLLFVLLFLVVIVLLAFVIFSKIYLSAVDEKDDNPIEFVVTDNLSGYVAAEKLEDEGLIRKAFVLKLYLKLHPNIEFKKGTYVLTKSMDIGEITSILSNPSKSKENEPLRITFIEGKRLTDYAKVIADALNKNKSEENKITSDEIIKYIDSKEFVDKQIQKYDFITDVVYDEHIYHPLEGYLFPDTYEFNQEATLDDIIDKLLSTMGKKLEVYKDDLSVAEYTIHEMLTLASIIELEGSTSDDRAGVAGVFYNRLKTGEPLGSDVTTYYGSKKDFSRDLSKANLKDCNGYNTRAESSCPILGLPVGPICSPSLASINATIEPEEHDYYFFVADKNKKTYFSKTYSEHVSTVAKLKKDGLWYEY